jgi:hypothetical protein
VELIPGVEHVTEHMQRFERWQSVLLHCDLILYGNARPVLVVADEDQSNQS